MPSDRREYYRQRRQRLAQDEEWKRKEAERKAAWYQEHRKTKPKPKLSELEKKARRREYDRRRRERLSKDPAWLDSERARRRESYHRNK